MNIYNSATVYREDVTPDLQIFVFSLKNIFYFLIILVSGVLPSHNSVFHSLYIV